MEKKEQWVDFASVVTLVLTIGLFGVALFEKGFTQELLLEAGVFLVSAKLVIGNYQNRMAAKSIEAKLDVLLKRAP